MKFTVYAILILLFSGIVRANFLDLQLSCEDIDCIPNRVGLWNLTITNLGQNKLKILGFRIIDVLSKEDIFLYEQEKPVTILTAGSHIFSLKKKIPNPTVNNTLTANICLIVEPDLESWGKSGKMLEHCYYEYNFSFPIIKCLENLDCEDNKYCTEFECIDIPCGYCQYAKDYQCNNYECCINEECSKNMVCENHLCKELICKEEEYIVNHTCSNTICEANEGIINFTCSPLNCSYSEVIENHDCVPLECTQYEGYFNHSCLELNCSFDEFHFNHTCNKLNCEEIESPINHSCELLKCNIFQKPQGYECRINSFILLQAFFLFIIFFLIFLNIEKFLLTRRKKIADILFKRKEKI